MAMGKRKRDRQPTMWVMTCRAASHPFYTRLNQLLREHEFDDFAEAQCATFYADTMGRPGLPPGIYFRLLLIGYFEGIDSERGIAWRAADSFALREFSGRTRQRAARSLDDFADASVDRSRNASRRFHLGAAVPEHGRPGEGQDDWNRRDHAGGQRGVAKHCATR
jgi:hypothetical protein